MTMTIMGSQKGSVLGVADGLTNVAVLSAVAEEDTDDLASGSTDNAASESAANAIPIPNAASASNALPLAPKDQKIKKHIRKSAT